MSTAIEFQNVSKQYRLGRVGTGTLRHDLNRWWQTAILDREDPYLKIGETNDPSTKGSCDYVWALRDISFKVEQGDVLGIIGKNGAGKSTLLKLLSHITAPTIGTIGYNGRIASLLEVGTGFHPEMTARENIYMNGSIMGMTRHEINSRFDEIVDFAGIERYLDTPVKRFSSGMIVRLGFAVAAFLEAEILVADEVLAVGDAEFQKKAIGKMKDVSVNGGRTVLFVSHNMAAVKSLCNNGVVLKDGMMDFTGTADDCVDHYMQTNITELRSSFIPEEKSHWKGLLRELEFTEISMLNDVRNVSSEEPLVFEMKFKRNDSHIRELRFGIIARGSDDNVVWLDSSHKVSLPGTGNMFKVRLELPHHNTPKGRYYLNFVMSSFDSSSLAKDVDAIKNALSFEVTYIDKEHTQPFITWPYRSGTKLTEEIISIDPL